ncbi:MAG: PAS domain-containing sensor histidine kinase [Gemmatimonadetes bacterium SCN 70-22]|nr:MAG: PAS domain-containing sensor histidine kinase [Gemmatimonadetes bacterium SCN 70-22]
MEGALQESEARFEAILEGTPNGVVMVDADGRMVFVNHEVERLFGYGREELLGQPVERLIPERFAAGHPRLRRDAMHLLERREMGADRDLFARRRDGSEFPVVVGLNPVRRNGQSYVVTSVVDISARKDAERELKRSNDELQRFAYVASHDLQEPLRTVASYVQLLERRYGDRFDADGREFMAFVVDGARRMQRMVDDLLTLSRVGSHGVELVPVPADEVLDRAIDDLKLALEESGATVTRAPLPVVRGDARQLEQLFANLIGNALKFAGPTAPRIEVGARREGAEWVISVRDHGIGIEPQYFDRIFVIFQRLHGRDEYPGTGIGLAICKKIVERHGGRIWVDSQPGAGSTFHFTLAAPQEG